ncbi:MAG: tetratricopeptide repeat protein [Ruegeria sp.]|uniref:tetratricopeptide repeat protein n=1 Tax=Ruegeria sp. TaxID=1879320 RepID=UPI00349E8B3D
MAAFASSGDASAKPLLTDSQLTYASACIAGDDTAERLIEICTRGLEENGASDGQRIEMLDRLAWSYINVDDLDRADATFGDILTIDPQAEPGLQGHAWIFYMRDDYAAAAELFRQAVARKPRGQNMAGLAASQYHAKQIDLDEFTGYMRAALALDPDYRWAIRELGWVLAYADRYEPALEQFRTALAKNEWDANAEYGLAYVLSQQDKWHEAFDHVTRALEIDPDYISARSRRSLILLNLDRPKQALKDADAVIEAWPEADDGYVRKARALVALGRGSEANELLTGAEKHAGASSYLLFWRAKLLADDGDYVAALTQIERSVALEEADHYDHRLHAEIAMELDRLPQARAAIDRALQLKPGDSYTQFINALVLLREERFEQGEAAFDAAIEAGLHGDYLGDFLSALVDKSRFMQAIQMRVRYSDRTDEAESSGSAAGSN